MLEEEKYDIAIADRISMLESSIREWANANEIWDEEDSKFWSHLEYFDVEPLEIPCLLVLTSSGELGKFLDGEAYDELHGSFYGLMNQLGVHKELESYGVATFWLTDEGDPHIAIMQEFFEWQWICELIRPEFSELYVEIYEWFSKKPDDFAKLSPRGFEVIIDGILRNNGYRTQLGTGQADGGVDIRLYSNEVIGEAVTLVQAKRYAKHRPIGLEAVQALSATVDDERANRGLFVATSRYLPGAEKFAHRQNRKLQLATSHDLAEWSGYAKKSIIRDKSKLVSPQHVQRVLQADWIDSSLESRIFRASYGTGMILNSFVVVLRETKTAVLVMSLPKKTVSGDDLQGFEVPVRDKSAMRYLNKETVFRARKSHENGRVTLWGDGKLYSEWSGDPEYFSQLDRLTA